VQHEVEGPIRDVVRDPQIDAALLIPLVLYLLDEPRQTPPDPSALPVLAEELLELPPFLRANGPRWEVCFVEPPELLESLAP
jgi:hypothetical protein